ncbi:MAG: ABC1 kinase family protein [Acidimicrobiia bacterium]
MGIAAKGRHLRRYGDMARLLVKYGRSDLVKQMGLEEIDLTASPGDGGAEPPPDALELANDLERLGPTYIKLGQLLSTRTDIIPPVYAEALTRLQDDVEPITIEEVEQVFSDEIGTDTKTVFERFDPEPLASASLGQVHRATLRSGREVVVKIQRPGIRQQIEEDMEALTELAHFIDDHTEAGRRFGLADLLSEFHRSLIDELDYRREAANLRRLREIVEPYELLVVPEPVADLTTTRVLTMDYIQGKKVTDLGPLAQMEIEGRELASQLFRAYLDQILTAGFFHADPHPGNVTLGDDGRLALLDLGMVARVPKSLQNDLVKLLLAISDERGEDAADITIRMGTRLDGFDEDRFIRGANDLVARNRGRGMGELNAGSLVMQITQLAGETGLRLPPELAMLGKALLNLDQVARVLDPDFDPAAAIQEHADQVMQARLRPSREGTFAVALEAKEFMEQLPSRMNRLLDAATAGELKVNVEALDEDLLIRGIQKVANRITMGLLLAALIVGAAMLTGVEAGPELLGYPAVAIVCFILAALGAFVLLISIAWNDRRAKR